MSSTIDASSLVINAGLVAENIENGTINFDGCTSIIITSISDWRKKIGLSFSCYEMIQAELEKTSHLVEHERNEERGAWKGSTREKKERMDREGRKAAKDGWIKKDGWPSASSAVEKVKILIWVSALDRRARKTRKKAPRTPGNPSAKPLTTISPKPSNPSSSVGVFQCQPHSRTRQSSAIDVPWKRKKKEKKEEEKEETNTRKKVECKWRKVKFQTSNEGKWETVKNANSTIKTWEGKRGSNLFSSW